MKKLITITSIVIATIAVTGVASATALHIHKYKPVTVYQLQAANVPVQSNSNAEQVTLPVTSFQNANVNPQ